MIRTRLSFPEIEFRASKKPVESIPMLLTSRAWIPELKNLPRECPNSLRESMLETKNI